MESESRTALAFGNGKVPALLRHGITAALVLVCAGAWAQAPSCGSYHVAFYETGLLYFKGRRDEYVGIDRAVLDEVARRTGCTFEGFMDSRVRTWTALSNGQLDMTVSGIETPQRRAFAIFIPYVLNNRNYLIARNALASRIKSMQDFWNDRSLRLGIVKGFVHGETLDTWIAMLKAEGRVDEVSDLELLAKVFAAGRVDALLTQPAVWPPLLERNHLNGKVQKIDVAPRDSAVLCLVLSRRRVAEGDVERIRLAIEDMRKDGSLEAIFKHYVGADMAKLLAGRPADK